MFTLLDEQRTAYEYVLHDVSRARRANKKTAVVVTGGPGSGKSVIALSLLGDLSRQGRSVVHATGSQSFTKTLRRVAGARSTRTQRLFMYFNSFMNAEPNELDCLILDEAHRIRSTSANRYTSRSQRDIARPQVQELLSASRVPVFLLDQYQVVRPGEVGTVDIIIAAAKDEGIDVEVIKLDDQFRCGGSKIYISWVLGLLGLDHGEAAPWRGDNRFELDVADSPDEMESRLQAWRSQGYGARMAAGYCWPWSDPRGDGTLVNDVVIGSWTRPWNLKGDRSIGGAPASPYWATDPAGFGQVGCVYTAQGFEYDYAGVILGPDLVWRADRWVTNRDASKDPAFRSRKTVSDSEFDRLVRHVYKVLLTRGLRGALLYSTDPETQSFLTGLTRSTRRLAST
ncbi:DNA/RNA helicase domain-containing protein [Microlunatus sp. GCM10028923]|uniref:DNA/RNA helicase domain-containing protein n=1 Tax=Microlunatus sp. GCM10028923 TaxID=3273400 RepID=UPI00360D77C0